MSVPTDPRDPDGTAADELPPTDIETFGMSSYTDPDYGAPDLDDDDDDDRDFTAEHVGMVVPPVEQAAFAAPEAAGRHLGGPVGPVVRRSAALRPGRLARRRRRPVPRGQPDASEHQSDAVPRRRRRPGHGRHRSARSSLRRSPPVRSSTTVVESAWLGERIRVTAIPVRYRDQVVAVVARESALSMNRQRGELERVLPRGVRPSRPHGGGGRVPLRRGRGPRRRRSPGRRRRDPARRPRTGRRSPRPNAISALRRLGVSGQVLGQKLTDLGAESAATYRAFFNGPPTVPRRSSATTPASSCAASRCSTSGRVDGAVVLLRDVSELRSRDRLLVSKDATIKEIHHRVKNNLQTISSLLRLQGRRLTEPSAKTAIEESVRRIRSIALVHETLSREDGDDVDFGEVVRPLVRMVEEGLTSPDRPVRLLDLRRRRQAAVTGGDVAGGGADRTAPERRRPRLSRRHPRPRRAGPGRHRAVAARRRAARRGHRRRSRHP